MTGVIVARDAILFLCAWELMTLLTFLLVSFEDERAEVRRAAFLYVTISHVAALLGLAFFLLLAARGGTSDLDALAARGGWSGAAPTGIREGYDEHDAPGELDQPPPAEIRGGRCLAPSRQPRLHHAHPDRGLARRRHGAEPGDLPDGFAGDRKTQDRFVAVRIASEYAPSVASPSSSGSRRARSA